MGAFPETGLARARKLRDEAKPKLAEGHDPVLERKIAKVTAKLNAGITFALIAREYIQLSYRFENGWRSKGPRDDQ